MTKVSFEGQVVAITGAGGGLGRAYALEIAARGGAVVVNDLGGAVTGGGASTGYADAVVDEIRASGGRAVASYDSVATVAGGEQIITAALDHFGRIDAVIANAGNMRYAPFEELTLDDLNALLAVHIGGSWNVAKAAWGHMKRQAYGRLVFTTSSGGMFGTQKLSAYGAAKGGVMGLMHSLADEGQPHGIICNAVMPNAMSRMTSNIQAGELGDNPWGAKVPKTFDPAFTVGLSAYLASRDCVTAHGIYTALGGRIGRAFVGVAEGMHGSIDVPPTVEDVAANWELIRDASRGYAIPGSVSDEWRSVVEGRY